MNLLLFNWFGYRLVLSYLQQQADLRLEARIDIRDYDESQLIEIRTPLQLPYQTTWKDFERCYGTIEIEGKSYTYVERKMVEGYMILKCIPNATKEVIKSTENLLANVAQGAGRESDKATSFAKAIKCYIGDFEQDKATAALQGVCAVKHTFLPFETTFLESGFTTSLEQPPDGCFLI